MEILYRIIDKKTGVFKRDDFMFDTETEIGLNVSPANFIIKARWNGSGWEEAATAEEIAAMEATQPTAPPLEEQVATLQAQLNALLGVDNG